MTDDSGNRKPPVWNFETIPKEHAARILGEFGSLIDKRKGFAVDHLDRMHRTSVLLNAGGIVVTLPLLFQAAAVSFLDLLLGALIFYFVAILVVVRYHWLSALRGLRQVSAVDKIGKRFIASEIEVAELQGELNEAVSLESVKIPDYYHYSPIALFVAGSICVFAFVLLNFGHKFRVVEMFNALLASIASV